MLEGIVCQTHADFTRFKNATRPTGMPTTHNNTKMMATTPQRVWPPVQHVTDGCVTMTVLSTRRWHMTSCSAASDTTL